MEEVVGVDTNKVKTHRTGSDLIADFVAARCHPNVFVVNGGAAAFMIDAIGRNPETSYMCAQHEQAAAFSADGIWRVIGKVGVTIVTSGPGATNLITGVASSWFDSIPAMHITGQVNDREGRKAIGVDVRQAGFQETDIVSMVSTITKRAVKVETVSQLAEELRACLQVATSGRMGPVLIDVPMNVQQEPASEADYAVALAELERPPVPGGVSPAEVARGIQRFLEGAERPLAILGGGLGLAGTSAEAQDWCDAHGIPYVASWAGLTYLDRSRPGYQGSHGVYGSRHANWSVNAADRILVLGSRLDNRQRTGTPRAYAPFADIFVVDVDAKEVQKFHADACYSGAVLDLAEIAEALAVVDFEYDSSRWLELVEQDRATASSGWEASVNPGETNPYDLVVEMQKHFPPGSIVVADTGATLCWLFQAYGPDDSLLFTSGGNSPMGYSLPAAIGAQTAAPESPVICVIGDGGLQMNLQEMQTAVNYALPVTIVVFNNSGYGIIKQFQDVNTGGRYHASGQGYSAPDFGAIAKAYGIRHHRVESVSDIAPEMFDRSLKLIEFVVPPHALITPKVEGDHFIHDQFPYGAGPARQVMPFDYPDRPSGLVASSSL